MGLHVPRLANLPCKEIVEGSIPFGSTFTSEGVFTLSNNYVIKLNVLRLSSEKECPRAREEVVG